jgi:hypothetical protein
MYIAAERLDHGMRSCVAATAASACDVDRDTAAAVDRL